MAIPTGAARAREPVTMPLGASPGGNFAGVPMSENVVVVGTGQAAGQCAASLRRGGYEGGIVLVGQERHPPYQRPPLSKQYLAGDVGLERVHLKPAEFYEKARIELRLGGSVAVIDRRSNRIVLSNDRAIGYDKLVLATGSRPRKMDLPGADLGGIHDLRTLDDMYGLQRDLRRGSRLVIVGGGYIGLEVASVAARNGVDVTVLEMTTRPMSRVVGPEVSAFLAGVHRGEGVSIETGKTVSAFEGEGRIATVVCDDGARIDAEAVLVGVGVVPNTEIAAAAGLETDDGIVVDKYCRTTDPDIYAIGDCTRHPYRGAGGRVRLESVPNALGQARVAAANICKNESIYAAAPWFWSDQYDTKLQISGMADGHDQVVIRGTPDQREFIVFYLQGRNVVAAESVNSPRDFMVCKRLVDGQIPIAADRLTDLSRPLTDLAA